MARGITYAQLAAAGIRGLHPYAPGKPLDELEREYGIENAIKLASNENPSGPSPRVLAAIEAASLELTRYPDGSGFHLKAALAEQLGVSPEQLTLGNGSNDVLVLLAETFLTPDSEAIYADHSFIVYRLAVQATGATALIAPANPADHTQPLGHDLEAMLERVTPDTRLVFIANPNNPTGTWNDRQAVRDFLERLPAEVIAVIDEAYYEYAMGDGYPETLGWLGEFPNLVITRTFSKVTPATYGSSASLPR